MNRVSFKTSEALINYLLNNPSVVKCCLCHESAFVSNNWTYVLSTNMIDHYCKAKITRSERLAQEAEYKITKQLEEANARECEPGGRVIRASYTLKATRRHEEIPPQI